MGVRGLQSFLESHCGQACYSVNIGKVADEYRRRTGKTPLIVVDGMSCMRKLYGKLNWICGGQWKGYIDHIKEFYKSLTAHNITLVIFFDGNTPERKRETWTHRRLENLKDVITYFSIVKSNKELEHGKHFFIPTGLAAFTPLIFKDILGCQVYTCLDECDKAVAEYAKKYGAMGILGQDSDYIIYHTAHYYFSINHLNLETLDTIMYDRNALARILHITLDQLPLLSCLIGNDVIRQEDLLLFHQQSLKMSSHHHHRHHNRPPPEILIPKVASFINTQPPMDVLLQQLPLLARVVFRDEGRAHLLVEGIKMYQLDIDGPDEFTERSEDTSGLDIMERVRIRHIDSELGRHLYTILRGESYESSTTLEDFSSNLPSGAIAFQPLRAKLYRILQKSVKDGLSQVPEWCMYSGSTLKEPDMVDPIELEGGSPSLEELWNGDEDLKWRTFLDCVHPKLCETKIRTFPQHLVVPVAILFYLQCSHAKPILKDWEMNAMIAAFLSPTREDLNQIRALALPRVDARAVHVAAIFMKGLANFYFLLATCDFPIHRKNAVPWAFWDGKVFHHYYLRAKLGAKIDDLCEHKALKLLGGQARCAGMESIMSRNVNNLLRNSNITCRVKPSRGMAGHSKWANIKHTKAAKDTEKTKLYTKCAQGMKAAIKEGGSKDPKVNSKLAKAIEIARTNNMPAASIKNVLDTYQKPQDNAKSFILEYKGPGGVFLVAELLTDNINRTKMAIQSSIKKFNIQEAKGSSNRIFEEKGIVVVNRQGRSLEAAMDSAIEVGSEDVAEEDDCLMFTCSPEDFMKVKQGLDSLNYEVIYAGVDYLPKVYVTISDDDEKQLGIILQKLEAIDEVMKVHVNLS